MSEQKDKHIKGFYNKIGKRGFDIVFSTVVVFLLLPMFVILSAAIKIDSKGQVIYKQKRIGREAKEFSIYKFRTMVTDADKIGPKSTSAGDGRITRVGKFLRKYSLDELPQFFNVLYGDMSIVGPRPDVKEYMEKYYKGENLKKYLVKPGITGYAQVNGRSSNSIEKVMEWELKYIKDISFWTDIRIIMRTIYNTMVGKDSY